MWWWTAMIVAVTFGVIVWLGDPARPDDSRSTGRVSCSVTRDPAPLPRLGGVSGKLLRNYLRFPRSFVEGGQGHPHLQVLQHPQPQAFKSCISEPPSSLEGILTRRGFDAGANPSGARLRGSAEQAEIERHPVRLPGSAGCRPFAVLQWGGEEACAFSCVPISTSNNFT